MGLDQRVNDTMASSQRAQALEKKLKKYAGPIYRRFPDNIKMKIKDIYFGKKHTSEKSIIEKQNKDETSVKLLNNDSKNENYQLVDDFLCHKINISKQYNSHKWINIEDKISIKYKTKNTTEIHIAIKTRVTSFHDKPIKIRLSCSFYNKDDRPLKHNHFQDFYISHSEQINAIRVPVPKMANCTILDFICSSDHQVEILNGAQIYSVHDGISVIIGVHKEEKFIDHLLRSLAAQTADQDSYELIFVINGERDASDCIIREWMQANPSIQASLVYEVMPSLSNARNVGITKAIFSHVTFVDCDDTISPEFLQSLLERLSPEQIACSHIVNINEDGVEDDQNIANVQLVEARRLAPDFPPQSSIAMSTMSACKAIPTFVARCVPFLVHLKNGEDTPFYCEIYARFPSLRLNADSDQARCVYFRLMRHGSLSRTTPNFQFNIVQRLDVVEALERLLRFPIDEKVHRFIINKRNSQVDFASSFVLSNPDQYRALKNEIERRDLKNFPYDRLKDKSTDQLVVSYCFPPFQDASAIVIAKRIFVKGELCDVISNKLTGKREIDERLLVGIEPFIAKHTTLEAPISFAGWKGISTFAEKAYDRAVQIQTSRKRNYVRLYSRAQWCASHFGALLIKIAQPEVRWTAEFSDPLLFNAESNRRTSPIELDWLREHGVLAALDQVGALYDIAETSLFYWCEICAIYLADELVFTNDNQLNYMCSYLDNEETVREAKLKATISPHPVAKGWLESSQNGAPNPRNLNLAYFGSFYPNRGTDLILQALGDLPQKQRKRTRFFIYSSQFQQAEQLAEKLGLGDMVICRPEIMYVDMLREMKKFDVLVVNDAVFAPGKINPFLPSKLSDYLLSGVPILALYQQGSALSKRPEPRYRARIYKSKQRQSEVLLELFHQAMRDKQTSFFAQDESEEDEMEQNAMCEAAWRKFQRDQPTSSPDTED